MDDYQKGYGKAIEDFANRLNTYYSHIDNTSGASVQFFVEQIRREYGKKYDVVGQRG